MEYLLSDCLDINSIAKAKSDYVHWLMQKEPLEIDAQAVVRVDASGLLLLASLFKSARNSDIAAKLINTPPELVENITLLGLHEIIEIEEIEENSA